jgi:thiol-disulfide isomerase/thioredoxin
MIQVKTLTQNTMTLRQLLLFTIVTLAVLPSCKNKNEIIITGEVQGNFNGIVEYTDPVDGVCNWWFKDSVTPDSSGRFMITIKAADPLFIKLRTSFNNQGTIVAEPGKTYHVRLDPSGPEKFLSVEGSSAPLQDAYNRLPSPVHIQVGAEEFFSDTSATHLHETVEKRKEEELQAFEKLRAGNIISAKVFDLVKADRECYYDAIVTTVAWIKYNMSIQGVPDVFTPPFDQLWNESFSKPLFNDNATVRSPWFSFYAESYIYYREYISGNFTKEKIDAVNPDSIRSYRVARAKEYLPPAILEDYLADYLYAECFQKNYEHELISLFDEFRASYPGSGYIVYLSPLVEEIAGFYRKVDEGFGEGVRFVENYRQLNTLKEVTGALPEGLIYVDVWATWCGPCKSEFLHSEELKELLAGKGVSMLYISIDRDQDTVKWKNMISYYSLDGYHVKANKELEARLRELFDMDGMIAIPWNMLVDEKGNILLRHASPPSKIDSLGQEIDGI